MRSAVVHHERLGDCANTTTAGYTLDGYGDAHVAWQCGLLLDKLGEHTEATAKLLEAEELLVNTGSGLQTAVFAALGTNMVHLGDLDRAGDYLSRSVANGRSRRAEWIHSTVTRAATAAKRYYGLEDETARWFPDAEHVDRTTQARGGPHDDTDADRTEPPPNTNLGASPRSPS
jgi:hypothetical protein